MTNEVSSSVVNQVVDHTYVTIAGQVVIATITGYLALKIAQLKEHVNSQFDKYAKLVEEAAMARGKLAGAAEEKAEVAAIAKGKEDSKL